MSKNVSDQIIEILQSIHVKQIFGIPGDTIDSLMESLRTQKEIEFIIMRHEETGAFAACAQAKLTGNLGVCVACQGPGAIHLLNGLYDAAMDRVPVLAITGQVESSLIGTHTVQEINQINLFNEVAIYNEEVRNAANLPEVLTQAIKTAVSQRGVAHISIPSDVMRAKAVDFKPQPTVFDLKHIAEPDPYKINQAIKLLNDAKKVAILYGGGCADAIPELLKTAELLKAPLVHTTRSKDLFDNNHPYYVGGIGLMGSKPGNYAVQQCDVLLVVGSSFAFKDFYPQKTPIIQMDIDPSRIGLRVPVTIGILADSQSGLSALNKNLVAKTDSRFLQHVQEKHEKSLATQKKRARTSKEGEYIHPQTLVQMVGRLAPDNTVFCIESGTASVWGNNYLHLNGTQRFLWSWNLASLGCGLSYALGCQLVDRKRPVIAICGDGGFEMLIGDLATIALYTLS